MKHITLIITFLLAYHLTGKPDLRQPQQGKPDPRQFEQGKPDAQQFPRHWGRPPQIQTRDMVKLPGKFGMGSSTLANWIRENLKKDAEKKSPEDKKPENNKPKPKPKPPEKPVPPITPIPPAEVKEKMDEYKATQKDLQSGLVEKIKELGKKPTKEAVRKVVEKYRKENAKTINAQKELGKEIHDWQKENRPERPKRPEPPEEVKKKLEEVKLVKSTLESARKSLQQDLKGKSKEDQKQLIEAFKESQKQKHEELKTAQKELQKQIREIKQTGDRRQ